MPAFSPSSSTIRRNSAFFYVKTRVPLHALDAELLGGALGEILPEVAAFEAIHKAAGRQSILLQPEPKKDVVVSINDRVSQGAPT